MNDILKAYQDMADKAPLCSCMTKTPKPIYHRKYCPVRMKSDMSELKAEIKSLKKQLSQARDTERNMLKEIDIKDKSLKEAKDYIFKILKENCDLKIPEFLQGRTAQLLMEKE